MSQCYQLPQNRFEPNPCAHHSRFSITNGASFVNLLASRASVGGYCFTVPGRNGFRATVRRDLSPLLRRVVFVGELLSQPDRGRLVVAR
jgi:hypothetical protein